LAAIKVVIEKVIIFWRGIAIVGVMTSWMIRPPHSSAADVTVPKLSLIFHHLQDCMTTLLPVYMR
jgi:hypothetical protein